MSPSANRFIASMNITYEMWHDGDGYDLDALAELPSAELLSIESILIRHTPRDWRDIEALARINSPAARKEIEAALKSSDISVRREAMNHVPEKSDPKEREKLLIKTLNNADLFGGLSQAIDEAEEFHPPAVMDALFNGALHRGGEVAVHFAALLFFLHGKSKEAFDWDHRPFFLQFHEADPVKRAALFRELCKTVGVDPEKYLGHPSE